MLVASSKVIKIGSVIMVALPEHIVTKIMLYVTHHPVALMYDSNRKVYDQIQNEKCSWRGYCACGNCHHMRSVSKAELLYLVTKPSYKLEKILETKVIMNWLLDKTDADGIKLLKSQEDRIVQVRYIRTNLKEHHPVFFHCNQDVISKCMVMRIRKMDLELYKYDDLYDQLYDDW